MTKDLYEFLKSWLEWAENGAPEDEPYCSYYGLCSNVSAFPSDDINLDNLESELGVILENEFSDFSYPFGGIDLYLKYSKNENQHENPLRLEWVKKKIAEYED